MDSEERKDQISMDLEQGPMWNVALYEQFDTAGR